MHVHANASAPGLAKSPAQQARNTYDVQPGTGFGQIVSQIARGIYDPSDSTGPTANGGGAGGIGTTTTDLTGASDGAQSAGSQNVSTDTSPSQTTGTVDVSV